MPDEELEQFKSHINLSEFAAGRGYALDKRESSRNSAVMRHPDGDKIIIARRPDGTWIYFSVRDGADNGSIIDFVQHRDGKNLGRVRQTLRPWAGGSPPSPAGLQLPLFARDLVPIAKDREAVLKAWEQAKPCFGLPYLTARGLGPEVFMLPRFHGRMRVDQRHNALFPHYDREGLCGYEVKNAGFTGFAAGGLKGLWHSKALTTDKRLVLVESAIDALSFHLLQGDEHTRYMSTGGELNPQQPVLLRGAMEKLPQGGVVLLAFDNDAGGEIITAEVEAVAPSGRDVRRVVPDAGTGKDWNAMLKYKLGLK